MSRLIAQHAMIGDGATAALVASDGAITWYCAPRFDRPPIFAALLGDDRHGAWLLGPAVPATCTERSYAGDGFALQTRLRTENGEVLLLDMMPPRGDDGVPWILRTVEGVRGSVPMRSTVRMRPDFGTFTPRVERRAGGGVRFYGAGDAAVLYGDVDCALEHGVASAAFTVRPGDRVTFAFGWHPPSALPPPRPDASVLRATHDATWSRWRRNLHLPRVQGALVARSAMVLRALIYTPTGALCAAPTTSLPERIGGDLNWDYRYGWIRDTAFGVWALLAVGASDEAAAATDWLLRTSAGRPEEVQPAYSFDGDRRIVESIVEELPGYRGSRPVRCGNAAAAQMQIDVYGEIVLAALRVDAAKRGYLDDARWNLVATIADGMAAGWDRAGHGFWEVRGPARRFLADRGLSCVALRAAAREGARRGQSDRAERWHRAAEATRRAILHFGVDRRTGTLVPSYAARRVGATALYPIILGLLEDDTALAARTVDAVARRLTRDGLVYRTTHALPAWPRAPREGAFLPCTGWLVRAEVLLGRTEAAAARLERFAATANDVGIFSEEFDPATGEQLGNTPQAFTHAEFILAAAALDARDAAPPLKHRGAVVPGAAATGNRTGAASARAESSHGEGRAEREHRGGGDGSPVGRQPQLR